ncbi:hypothetical protein [uncultured Lutibacter sp.]|uniref:hypothetical protein n=1 Tax=uncultured Lutibacter sp. TaxID=437739 RepID=UPI0026304E8D|nr:hypothetical protein [uncultured Lutibacter sp.]
METNISRVKELILKIGKCNLKYEHDSKIYSLNDFNTTGLDEDYYSSLNNEFQQKLTLQLVNKKLDKKLLKELITNTNSNLEDVKSKKDQLRVNYLFDKGKNCLDQDMLSNQEYIFSILEAQFSTLNNMHKFLLNLYEEYDYILDEELAKLKSNTVSYESSSENVKLPRIGKATINLRKKDSISLLLLLEHLEILDFSDTDKIKFIENNFNYKNNNGFIKPIINMNSDLSNLKDQRTYGSRNSESFKRLIEKIKLGLDSFEFKSLAARIK